MRHSHALMVSAHEKSVNLGGALTLFPVAEALTNGFAQQIKLAIERAENAAYAQAQKDARLQIKKALGL